MALVLIRWQLVVLLEQPLALPPAEALDDVQLLQTRVLHDRKPQL